MTRSIWNVVFIAVILLTVLCRGSLTIEGNVTNSQPKYIVCWENHLDAIVNLANGKLYGLKAGWVWQLVLDESGNLELASENAHRSNQLWKGAPDDFDFVFTMPRLDNRLGGLVSETPGKTIFGRLPNFYAYDNFKPYSNDTMLHWESSRFADNRFVFTMHDTALVLVAKIGFIPDGIKGIVGGTAFMFDDIDYPEMVGIFEMAKAGLPWLKLKQMIPIQLESSQLYLAIFNYGAKGSFYCIFSVTISSISPCSMKPISSAFSCPAALMSFKRSNWAHTLFVYSGATLKELIIFLIGALLGTVWLMLIISADALKHIKAFYSSNLKMTKVD